MYGHPLGRLYLTLLHCLQHSMRPALLMTHTRASHWQAQSMAATFLLGYICLHGYTQTALCCVGKALSVSMCLCCIR
jgi:hypothetical protein